MDSAPATVDMVQNEAGTGRRQRRFRSLILDKPRRVGTTAAKAVAPALQRPGLDRRLLAFAEAAAVRRGYPEVRLYTHQTMTENHRLYTGIGYSEAGRWSESGSERVFMRKRLVD